MIKTENLWYLGHIFDTHLCTRHADYYNLSPLARMYSYYSCDCIIDYAIEAPKRREEGI